MLHVFMCFCVSIPSGWYGRLPDLYMLNVVVEDQIERDCEHPQHDEIMPKRGRASCEVIKSLECTEPRPNKLHNRNVRTRYTLAAQTYKRTMGSCPPICQFRWCTQHNSSF